MPVVLEKQIAAVVDGEFEDCVDDEVSQRLQNEGVYSAWHNGTVVSDEIVLDGLSIAAGRERHVAVHGGGSVPQLTGRQERFFETAGIFLICGEEEILQGR